MLAHKIEKRIVESKEAMDYIWIQPITSRFGYYWNVVMCSSGLRTQNLSNR